ncbi:hypothetical protein BGZ76_010667 [Entomortierella beljakovae]|nr:hypothetical protein BGZ76_010667 [Entomortierella beljakovae]
MHRIIRPSILEQSSIAPWIQSSHLIRSNTTPPRTVLLAKRYLNTQRPLLFSASQKYAREDESKLGEALLDKIGETMHKKKTVPDIITTKSVGQVTTAIAGAGGTGGQKVFTVRPTTSWIDTLAQIHGAPLSVSSGIVDPDVKYDDRKLVLKTMTDSYTEVILPFGKDKELLEEYVNFGGNIRHGKVMEDLDALAGAISYKHCDDGNIKSKPIIIVTAAVDRIDIMQPFGITDLRLSGHVTHVGYSSMEVYMKMEAIPENPEEPGTTILTARFTMVARDALTSKAAQVNPLELTNDSERKLFQISENRKAMKRLAAESDLTKRPPSEEERFLIHDMYLQYSKYEDPKAVKPENLEWMSETKMSSIHIMQPQDRNIHDKIFGGYLMRLAYELAFCNTALFIKCRPKFLALDEISFRAPVNIGSFLALDSQIVYSEGGDHHSLQVMVKADVLDIAKNTRKTTNTFWFTFTDPQTDKLTPKVMPRTYGETILYIEGKRRRNEGVRLARISRANAHVGI